MAAKFDYTLFVSREEANLFDKLSPNVNKQVRYRTQGVDGDYFDPELEFNNPFNKQEHVLVFTGVMDYWPNVDAVKWFAEYVFPKVLTRVPNARFCIVGMNPSDDVRALTKKQGVTVTGSVPDVRPYLAHSSAVVIPLRIARGIQNKVLEAMAMEKPVVVTPEAMAGIDGCPEVDVIVTEDAEEMADAVITLLNSEKQMNQSGRECILNNYNWDANLKRIAELLTS
jgi:sugar transferase (PEP-CTERM/EpsH1 system associated)